MFGHLNLCEDDTMIVAIAKGYDMFRIFYKNEHGIVVGEMSMAGEDFSPSMFTARTFELARVFLGEAYDIIHDDMLP